MGELSRELNEQVELIRSLLQHSHLLGALKREQLLELLRSVALDTSAQGVLLFAALAFLCKRLRVQYNVLVCLILMTLLTRLI